MNNYIGITGFTKGSELISIINSYEKNVGKGLLYHNIDVKLDLMMGFLISYKGLYSTDFSPRFVKLYNLPELLKVSKQSNCLNIIHYCSNRDQDSFYKEVSKILDYSALYRDGYIQGVQLNLDKPNLDEIKLLKKNYEQLKIVFQYGKFLLLSDFQKIFDYMNQIKNLVDYILIDNSEGAGSDFNMELYKKRYDFLRNDLKYNGKIVFAGGLSSNNVGKRVKEIATTIDSNDFSIDAEGKLRNELNQLKVQDCEVYLEKAIQSYLEIKKNK